MKNTKKKFRVPNEHVCAEAIGIIWKKDKRKGEGGKKLALKHTSCYTDTSTANKIKPFLDPRPFSPIAVPGEGDWLDEFEEEGQPFHQFVKEGHKGPTWKKDSIYIMPLGDFSGPQNEKFCKTLHTYASLFYCMRVQMMETTEITGNKSIKSRPLPYSDKNPAPRQYLTKDLLKLIGKNLPASGYCAIGITMDDLYPEEDWNFVFGEATDKGTGVFSFARYAPAFYDEPQTAESDKLLLARSLKVMVHEIGHMFGLDHCIYYKCIMTGSNSLEEEDTTPFHLCPVCLRKLQYSIGFDVAERYKGLNKFYSEHGFTEAAEWTSQWLNL